jgi:Bacterial Ig-like domain
MHKFAGLLATISLIGLSACGPMVPVALTIQSPAATAHTKGTVDVQVSISSDPQGSVVLLKNGVLLATLSAPYKYAWDTAPEPEGQYVLTARIRPTNQGFDSPSDIVSPPRTVIVDRTPPTVVNRAPAPGSSNVRLDDPVSLTFSEPVNPASVTDASVNLLSSGSSTPKTLALSSDGKTLTVKPTQALDPGNPVTFSATPSSAITDLAGNALVVPADAWNWTLPVWWTVGGATLNQDATSDVFTPRIVLDAKGDPIVAWSEYVGADSKVFVKRWTGKAWAIIGPGAVNVSGSAVSVSLALEPGGNPVIAWSEVAPGVYDGRVMVKRWNGSSWLSVGPVMNIDQNKRAVDPTLVVDSSGSPFLTWAEDVSNTSSPLTNVFVKRWTGASWEVVGQKTVNQNAAKMAFNPTITLATSGNPVVAWGEIDDANASKVFVKFWDGSSWQLRGNGAINKDTEQGVGTPALAFNASGTLFVAYSETANPAPNVFVKRWTGSAWETVGPGTVNQDAGLVGQYPSLTVDPNGSPVVAWSESYGRRKPPASYLKRWSGSSWALVGGGSVSRDPNPISSNPSVVLDSSDRPFVVLLESTGQNTPVFVKRFNR